VTDGQFIDMTTVTENAYSYVISYIDIYGREGPSSEPVTVQSNVCTATATPTALEISSLKNDIKEFENLSENRVIIKSCV